MGDSGKKEMVASYSEGERAGSLAFPGLRLHTSASPIEVRMDDLRSRLERALADTHVFQRELGGGGMSRTYLAVERALNRQVVVKVLAPELIAGISFERFRREVLLAAQLQHPHVVPVLTAGEADGLPWFTMPYVDGESLRRRLAEGPLSSGEVVSILRDVARALAYAHGHGIVHRDIKPDNVLLSVGSATVTDFGIAKAIAAARDGGEDHATLTQIGTSIGTPSYMAPEQAAGDPHTDHRADIYSFGAMAYELVAGQPPFQASTPARLLAAHMTEAPRDVRSVRPDAPPLLADLIMACLAKEPSARPQQATDLVRVLDSVTASGDAAAVPAVLRGGRVPLGKALGLWAGATVLVGVVAWAAMNTIGLPDWVLPGSLGVMLAGLPVIGATAFVQRAAQRAFTTTPQRTPGGTPTAQGTLATIALKASPHVSWRRTWLGGSIALAAFLVLVVGFMVTRAVGIGPAASLKGKGAFGEQETVVVADFRSPANDSTLGPTVAEALRTDLAQSRALNVLTRASVRDILRLMERPAESVVPFELAREIATREGAKAVLDGEIVRLGQSYVVSARLVSALDGQELATFRETADGENELIGALGKLSRAVRERAGESLRTIRASSSLERVTTPSLPALRKYVEGSLLADEAGEPDRGLALLEEAVRLDTAFAMAWRKISVVLGNEDRDREKALAAVSTAYRHRSRLTEMERLLTEGYYYTRGPKPDRDKALAAYEEAIRLDSTSTSALNNAAVVYGQKRDYERAEALYRRVVALPRTFGGAFTNLIQEQIRNGRLEALDSTIAAYRARFPSSNDLWEAEWFAAWARRDLSRADSISRAVHREARTSRQAVRSAGATAALAELRGRWREGLQWTTRRSDALLRTTPAAVNRLNFALDTAYYLAVYEGAAPKAQAALERGLGRVPMDSIPPTDRPWEVLADIAATAGDAALARRVLAGYQRDEAPLARDPQGREAFYQAHVAFAEQRWDDAARLMREADARTAVFDRYAWIWMARAHDLAGRPDSATVYYEKFLTRPDAVDVDSRWRPSVHRWLGEIYEAKGDAKRAIDHYGRFVELWADADPELQPQVREVRIRLDRLRTRVG
jgi:tetratricopeptide (TPR) repeat protein/tRNA A-37 threonylcarbamoyl transferase component Bud32